MQKLPLTPADKQLPYADFYDRPSATVAQSTLDRINSDHDPADALLFKSLNDMLKADDLPMEIGHCRMPNGSFFVAVQTPMPKLTAKMINWWFDWHPKESLRYRIWFPETHFGISFEDNPNKQPGDLPHWHTTHHPIEDIGIGKEEISIHFLPPAEFGFDTSRFENAGVETVICGLVGSKSNRAKQVVQMCHVVQRTENGLTMRSRFWMGNDIIFLPFLGSKLLGKIANTRFARLRLMPDKTGYVMAMHCAQEYANLAQILPELYARFG